MIRARTPGTTSAGPEGPPLRIAAYVTLVVVLVLVPFAIWEGRMTGLAQRALTDAATPTAVAAAVVAFLAADVLLPVPSSIVSAGAGSLLGFRAGFAAIWIGMTAGCLVGFGLGRFAQGFVRRRLLTDDDLARIRAAFEQSGGWLVVTSRPVPVLAELVMLTAGVAGLRFLPVLALSAAANVVIAAVYAAAGSYAYTSDSLTIWVFAALGVPWIARAAHRRLRRG